MAASPALGSTSGTRRESVGEGERTRRSEVSTSNLLVLRTQRCHEVEHTYICCSLG